MPTNIFEPDQDFAQRASGYERRLSGVNNMIQGQGVLDAERLKRRYQQGEGKYAKDMALEQSQVDSQNLANLISKYHQGREMDYNNSFQNPEMQAMFKAYQESGHMPYGGPMRSPEQLHEMEGLQKGESEQDTENKRIAAQLLIYAQPGTPQHDWALRTVGIPSVGTNAPAAVTPPTTPKPGRGATGVFMHELAPYAGAGAGTWAGVKAGAKRGVTRGPWGAMIGGGVGGGVGYAATKMGLDAMGAGELTPEEKSQHSLAAGSGNALGFILNLLLGGKAYKGAPPVGPGGGSLGGGAALMPPGISINPRYNPPPQPVGGRQPLNTGSGVGQSSARMSRQPFNVAPTRPQPQPASPTPMRVGGPAPIPMGNQPVATPPLSPPVNVPMNQPIPMGNQPVGTPQLSPPLSVPGNFMPGMQQPVGTPGLPPGSTIPPNAQLEKFIRDMMQGPQLPTAGPGVRDPQLQLLIQQLFKKVQPGQTPPPLVNP